MAAYVIVELDIHDLDGYRNYGAQALPTIVAGGGRVLVASNDCEAVEGEWTPKRLVVLEFPDMETAKAWYASEAYAGPKQIRLQATTTQMVFVPGFTMPTGS